MDDLTRCLYEFACEKRLGSLLEDEGYKETLQTIESQKAKVESVLDGERRQELELLIDCVASQGGIVGEHLFQAALALSKELTRLPAP